MNNRTRVAVERQITAMGADVFEVGLFKPRVPGDSSNEPEMLPRVWDRETLLRSVSCSPTKTPTVATFMSAPKESITLAWWTTLRPQQSRK